MTVREFCKAHGGQPGHMINITDKIGFTSMQTVDGTCYISFAKKQFGTNVSEADAKNYLKTLDLDVLETESVEGKPCFVIVKHSDLYEAFDF